MSPTFSMSVVRKHFCDEVMRCDGGSSCPAKYALSGCMPAVVSRTDGSNDAGTSEPEARRSWPRSSMKERKVSRISSVVTG